jgi:hypothetical protein
MLPSVITRTAATPELMHLYAGAATAMPLGFVSTGAVEMTAK